MTLIASPRPTADRASERPGVDRPVSTYDLALVVRRVASEPRRWRPNVRFAPDGYQQQLAGPRGTQVWLRTWLPSQRSGLHDDGGAASAFAVVEGALTEVRVDDVLGTWSTTLQAPAVRVVEPGVVLDLRGHLKPAVTIHVYAPRLERSTFYDLDHGALTVSGTAWAPDGVTAGLSSTA
jgi:hypothetical protein